MRRMVLNATLFQVGWLVCVVGGNTAALLWLPPYLYIHFRWVSQSHRELTFMLAVAALGISLDTLALATEIYTVPGQGMVPPWLACLWVLFATLVPHGLSWLRGRLPLAALLGAVGGTTSYFAGIQVGVASTGAPVKAALFWATQWALLMPVLVVLAEQWLATPTTAQPMARSGQ